MVDVDVVVVVVVGGRVVVVVGTVVVVVVGGRVVVVVGGTVVLVVVGSLLGEAASLKNWIGLGGPWWWIGTQGWEYLDLGRLWQALLTVGMVVWVVILIRGLRGKLSS